MVIDYAGLYPEVIKIIEIDLLMVNRKITIDNIINDTDIPLEVDWYELCKK